MSTNIKYRPDKEQEIAFFPLSIIISPEEKVPLRIFEPRYIELISHIENTGELFAIPFLHNTQVTSLGSIVKLSQVVEKHANGELTILIEGVQFCEIIDFSPTLPEKLYGGGIVIPFPNKIYSTNKVLIYYLTLLEWQNDPSIMFASDLADVYNILNKLNLTNYEKYSVLLQKNKESIEVILINYLKYYKMLYIQEKQLNKNYSLN